MRDRPEGRKGNNMNDFNLFMVDEIYTLCNKKRWYTCGTCKEYDAMFDMVKRGCAREDIAEDIVNHSNGVVWSDVLDELAALYKKWTTVFANNDE